jgi:hypothetical protein
MPLVVFKRARQLLLFLWMVCNRELRTLNRPDDFGRSLGPKTSRLGLGIGAAIVLVTFYAITALSPSTLRIEVFTPESRYWAPAGEAVHLLVTSIVVGCVMCILKSAY